MFFGAVVFNNIYAFRLWMRPCYLSSQDICSEGRPSHSNQLVVDLRDASLLSPLILLSMIMTTTSGLTPGLKGLFSKLRQYQLETNSPSMMLTMNRRVYWKLYNSR